MTYMSALCLCKPPETVESIKSEHTQLGSVIFFFFPILLSFGFDYFIMAQGKIFDIQYFSTVSLQIVYLGAVLGKIKAEAEIARPTWVTVASIVEAAASWFLNHIRLNVSPWIITNQVCSSWQFSKFPLFSSHHCSLMFQMKHTVDKVFD